MPVEIRELNIKTEISVNDRNAQSGLNEADLKLFKKNLLDECKKIIADNAKRNTNKR